MSTIPVRKLDAKPIKTRPPKLIRRVTRRPDATPKEAKESAVSWEFAGAKDPAEAPKADSDEKADIIPERPSKKPKITSDSPVKRMLKAERDKKAKVKPDSTEDPKETEEKGKDEYEKVFAKSVQKLKGKTEEEAGAAAHARADAAVKAMKLCISESKEEAAKIEAEKEEAEKALAKKEEVLKQAAADIQAKSSEVVQAEEAVVAEEEKVQEEKAKVAAEVVQIQEKSKELLEAQKEQQDVDAKVEQFTQLKELLEQEKEIELREVEVLNEVKRLEALILKACDDELDRLEQLKAEQEKVIAETQAQRLALQGEIEILVHAIAQHEAQKTEFEKEDKRLEKEANEHAATGKSENDESEKAEKEATSVEKVANWAKIAAGIAFAAGMAAAAFSFGIGAAIAAAAWAIAMIVFAERMSKAHSLRLKAAKHKSTAEKEKAKAAAKREAAEENRNKAAAKQTEINSANTLLATARDDLSKADSLLTLKEGELKQTESDQAQKLTERKECQQRIARADAELTLHECEGLNALGKMEALNTKINGLDTQAARNAVTTAQQGLASAHQSKTTQLGHMKTAVDGKVVAGKNVSTKVGEVDALERKRINAASTVICAQADVQKHVADKAAHEEHDKKQEELVQEVVKSVTDAVSAGMSAKAGNKAEVPDAKEAAADKPATTTPAKKSSATADTPTTLKEPVKKASTTAATTTPTKVKVPVKRPTTTAATTTPTKVKVPVKKTVKTAAARGVAAA